MADRMKLMYEKRTVAAAQLLSKIKKFSLDTLKSALQQLSQSRSWLNPNPTNGGGGNRIKTYKIKPIPKKTTKKHYRKHYNTKKKQVRRFVKKTKMNKKRISKQSRRRI